MADIEMAAWATSTVDSLNHADAPRGEVWAASGGERGIRGMGSSLKVSITPDGMIQVAPGAAVSPSPYPGHAAQSYSMQVYKPQTIAGIPTGSAGGRTDAVIIRVDDAELVSSPPADPATYQYARIEVLEGVPAGVTTAEALIQAKNINYPFVPLARLDVPANRPTGSLIGVTPVSMREMVAGQELPRFAPLTISTQTPLTATAMSTTNIFPAGFQPEWRAPVWATHMHIRMDWSGVVHTSALDAGGCVVHYGPSATQASTAWRAWNPGGHNSRTSSARDSWLISQEVPVPAAWRGGLIRFRPQAWRDSPLNGTTYMDDRSGGEMQVRFLVRPE